MLRAFAGVVGGWALLAAAACDIPCEKTATCVAEATSSGGGGSGGSGGTGTGGSESKNALGEACVDDAECESSHCVDDVCCSTACSGLCETCGTDGQCGFAEGGTDIDDECTDGVCSGVGWCATGIPQWAARIGGSGDDIVPEIDIDGESTVLAIRYDNDISLGTSDYTGPGFALARFDAGGMPTWSVGFSGSVGIGSIDQCPDGDLVVGGVLLSPVNLGGATLTPTAPLDVFAARLDSAGNHEWSAQYGAADAAEAIFGARCTPDGETVLVGTFQGAIEFAPTPPLTSQGELDIFVTKLAANGTALWSKRFGDSSNQAGTAVALTDDGGIIVSGTFSGSLDFGGGPLTPGTGSTQFLAKLDANGNHLWSRTVAESEGMFSYAVALDASGDIYLAGEFEGTATFDGDVLESAGDTDAMVVKFDSLGEFLWARRFGNFNSQEATKLAVSPEGFVVVGGSFTGAIQPGDEAIASQGGEDGFLVAYAPNGDHVWSQALGGAERVRVTAVGMRSDGDIIAAGNFDGMMDVGEFSLTSSGAADVFVTRVAR